LASGSWAGISAERFARDLGEGTHSRPVEAIGGVGLRSSGTSRSAIGIDDVVASVQSEMIPFDRNYWRSGPNLASSIERFDREWDAIGAGVLAAPAQGRRDIARNALRARETAALLATARWINASALDRDETRGLHRRSDFPTLDPAQVHHVVSGGLDRVWVRREPVRSTEKALAS
jgi:succinate dehydrogenase/fumarate reductase flavoprotein subunit